MRLLKELGLKVLVLVMLLSLVVLSFSHLQPSITIPTPKKEAPKEIMVEVSRQDKRIDQVPLEEYIVGVVSAEMPASFELEALKAQAVASRTFVMSRNLKVDDTVSSQVYYDEARRKENWGADFATNEARIEEAVNTTAGEVLMYDGKYISALFFSSSNGKTENNEDYFVSAQVPYLKSVDSSWDLAYDGTFRSQSFSLDELNTLFGVEAFEIKILSYKDSGRVDSVDVCGTVYSGRDIREKLGLASSDFDVEKDGENYVFKTVGHGHGVGMSQYGANGMAGEGYQYDEILKHYYQGVSIEKINEN